MKILIVEDVSTDRLMLRSAVQHLGHECLVAASGAEGWELFGVHQPDVVISDWQMPDTDGVELCRRIRAGERSTYTPFIFLTGLTDREHALAGMEVGADDVLTKPLDVHELRARLIVAGRLKLAEGRVIERTTALEAAVHHLEAEVIERTQAEATLRDSELRLRTVVTNAPVVLFAVDRQGMVTLFDGHALKALRMEPGQLVGTSALIPLPGAPGLADDVRRALTGEFFSSAMGSYDRVFETHFSPLMSSDGTVAGAIGVAVDISEKRAVEKLKDELVSVVTHELRTPLTSIRGSLGLLTSGVLAAAPERAQRMLEIARDSTDRLIRLINDLLDIERMESGQVALDRTDSDPTAVLQQAIDAVQPIADTAGVRLVQHLTPDLPSVSMDTDRIVQTLTNLIGNAIKFSAAGTTVSVGAQIVGLSSLELLVRVTDHGRGIPADNLGRIFERFRQVEASDARQKGGSGLGLAICRSIVEQHGGAIWVESEVGRGSTFSFTVPLAPPGAGG
jgi:signal transduction histidine kinase